MIRPITVVCGMLALGSGLYLYHAKHEVELMDKRIDQIAKETAGIRTESRHLLDEWIGLGEPEQLRKYSDQYLGLKSVGPTQFVSLSELSSRLPPPRAVGVDDQMEADAQPAGTTDDEASQADADDMPIPPIPPAIVAGTAPPVLVPPAAEIVPPHARLTEDQRPAVPKPVAMKPPSPALGQPPLQAQAQAPALAQAPAVAKPADPRAAEARREPRPAPSQQPVQMAVSQPPPAMRSPVQQGSLLGMSHGPVPLPLPAPTPVSATWPGR